MQFLFVGLVWFASGCLQTPPNGGHPCLRLIVPLAGPIADFRRQVSGATTTYTRAAPVTAPRAMPGAHKKGSLGGCLTTNDSAITDSLIVQANAVLTKTYTSPIDR